MGEHGDHFSKVERHFLEAPNLAKNNEKNVTGIVINAFSEPFVIPREMFEIIAGMDIPVLISKYQNKRTTNYNQEKILEIIMGR